ncbi:MULTISPECIES: SH3 domain-containing protein [Pontibacillus]|uniref:SH3 domain-containing protein n=1 Tax=Pontibacillus chungwhensis TaxID=265426 RepID=A0ABY8V1H8_9BACI|nr:MULTISPECIES: SH3 domain-containing protein [Pontibacillus]MCD5322204.1 ligand-binding protein SH3 [Pontibacillus sp. HN14]WIF99498.1 SH3 domain-containing protein [Pontibacillus chungwhensis]
MNNNIYIVIKNHISNYPNPIKLTKGQSVIVGEAYMGEENWDNWIYCHTEDLKLEGWVPEQIIDTCGKVLEDYVAKELNVHIGELLFKQKELNGWFWAQKLNSFNEGWIPNENVQVYQQD